jgi:hypothetical protein
MAQAKTRASKKRSQGSQKTQARSKARPKRSSGNRSRRPSSNPSSNGKTRVEAARQTVEHSTKEVGQTVGKVASKAKTPLLAGGAAVAGAAGGLAVSAMRSRQSHSRKVLGVKMPQPKRVKVRSRDVAKAAKEIGTFGQHVGELATELRHAREETGNGSKHRSPVEVVLDGLTARR